MIKKIIIPALFLTVIVAIGYVIWQYPTNSVIVSTKNILEPQKTATPTKRIGLQVGHLNIANVPAELNYYSWDFGAQVGDTTEVSLNYEIGMETATLLRQKGYIVDILTAAVPAHYSADAVVAIHADALPNGDTATSGFSVGASAYDTSGKAPMLALEIDRAYSSSTGLTFWPAISDAMTSYYSFHDGKFVHSVTSTTPSVLIECGFISNDQDRNLLIAQPELAAQGISQGIQDFLNNKSTSGLSYPTSSTETTS